MSIYLHDIPLVDAQTRLLSALKEADLAKLLGSEQIPLDEAAVGRVLSEAVWAKISSPHYHAAAKDGFALRSEDTIGAFPNNPISLTCVEKRGKRDYNRKGPLCLSSILS